MKKNLLLAGMLFISAFTFGQTKTVDLATGAAGTLATKIDEADRAILKELTIKGEINAVDFKFMRDQLPVLEKLDIAETSIVTYTGADGTYSYGDENTEYEPNHIPSQAFYNNATITNIVFPRDIIQVDYLAFSGTKLKEIDFANTTLAKIDGSGISRNEELKKITLSPTMVWIAENALEGNDALISFTCDIADPASINEGVYGMFGIQYKYDYENNTWVYDEDGNMIVESINGAPAGCTLYVPEGSVDKYKAADTWKTFSKILVIGSIEARDPVVSFAEETVTKVCGDEAFTNAITNTDNVEITYSSSDESVATVNAEGLVTIVGAGETTIKATTTATEEFNSIEVSYTLTVSLAIPTFEYATTTISKNVGDEAFTNELTSNTDAEATYASSDVAVATVDATGLVMIVGAGTTTITASAAATSKFAAVTATYTLTVSGADGIDEAVAGVRMFSVEDGIQVEFEGEAAVEVYTVAGVLVDKVQAMNQYHVVLGQGIYVVKVNGVVYKVMR